MVDVVNLIGSLRPGAQARQLLALLPALSARGVNSSVLVLDNPSRWGEAARQTGVNVEELGLTGVFDLPVFLQLRRRLQEMRGAVLHVWGPSAARVARACGIPASRLVMSGLFPAQPRLNWLDRRLFQGALAVDFTNSAVTAYRRSGWKAERVRFLPPGLPDPGEQERRPLPGVPESSQVLLGLGPLDLRKGFRDAVYAQDMLRHLDDRVRLILVGEGDADDALTALVEAFGAQETVLRPGWQTDPFPWLARADIVVAPMHGRGGVYGVLDAMLAGRPIVASGTLDLIEVVEHGISGIVVPISERMQLARECRFLLQDAERRQKLGQAARQAALKRFSLAPLVDALCDIYQRQG